MLKIQNVDKSWGSYVHLELDRRGKPYELYTLKGAERMLAILKKQNPYFDFEIIGKCHPK